MTDQAPELPLPVAPPKRWRVVLADRSTRSIEAPAFRVEHGALVLVLPAGNAAAYALGEWRMIESEGQPSTGGNTP